MQGSEESPQTAVQCDKNGTHSSQPHVAPQLADEVPSSKHRKPCSDTPPAGLISRPATRSTSCKPRRASERLSQGRSGSSLATEPAKIKRTAGNAAAKGRCSRKSLHVDPHRNAEPCACPASAEPHPVDAAADKEQSSPEEERAAITSHEVTSDSGLDQAVNRSLERVIGYVKRNACAAPL